MSVTVFKRKVSRSFSTRAAPFIWRPRRRSFLRAPCGLPGGRLEGVERGKLAVQRLGYRCTYSAVAVMRRFGTPSCANPSHC